MCERTLMPIDVLDAPLNPIYHNLVQNKGGYFVISQMDKLQNLCLTPDVSQHAIKYETVDWVIPKTSKIS